ncbi:hypothetical protein NPX13_g1017 [Xylaria arbuscula]|uniref:Uncharacterized protein n=1 Tax=Xylaria arbuscula TaxID=114810 RepID=A0A9W8TQK3_9PEZI|nr:hypothetical protein NPX13_g1017 [Xylaria arbuscula]
MQATSVVDFVRQFDSLRTKPGFRGAGWRHAVTIELQLMVLVSYHPTSLAEVIIYSTSTLARRNLPASLDLFVLTEHTYAAARLRTAVRLQSSDQVPRTKISHVAMFASRVILENDDTVQAETVKTRQRLETSALAEVP